MGTLEINARDCDRPAGQPSTPPARSGREGAGGFKRRISACSARATASHRTSLLTWLAAVLMAALCAGPAVAVSPPSIATAFGAASIPLNGATAFTFTISNPNGATSLTGVAFSDTLPSGLVVSTPNGLTGSCGGGTITATAGRPSISLSGATLAASASCTFSANVTATSAGLKINSVTVTSTNGGTSGTSSTGVRVSLGPINAHDFNGDGRSDIVWRQSGGTAAAWLMNGAQVFQSGSLGAVPVGWQI